MNGFSVNNWHDVVDPERSRIKIVKAYQASISDNAMQRKKGPEMKCYTSPGHLTCPLPSYRTWWEKVGSSWTGTDDDRKGLTRDREIMREC